MFITYFVPVRPGVWTLVANPAIPVPPVTFDGVPPVEWYADPAYVAWVDGLVPR